MEELSYHLRLILSVRLFLRLFSFAYPLYLVFMYNFPVFEAVSMKLWIGYIAFMALFELVLAVFVDRPFSRHLLKIYVFLAVFLEFPYALVSLSKAYAEMMSFLLLVFLWYGSLLLLLHLLVRSTNNRKTYML